MEPAAPREVREPILVRSRGSGPLLLRPLGRADLAWLREALAQPSVAAWWDVGTGSAWVDELLDDADLAAYVVEADGRAIGYVQWSEEDDPGYRHAAIDLFLTAEAQGRGHGRRVVHAMARWLVDVRGHHRLEIDPATANERAIRCYTAVGFRPIGVARRRERAGDGTWHDSLLMDLLAGELPQVLPEPPPAPGRASTG
jgi:aminoglycoside 6'-N-acetyltransferase